MDQMEYLSLLEHAGESLINFEQEGFSQKSMIKREIFQSSELSISSFLLPISQDSPSSLAYKHSNLLFLLPHLPALPSIHFTLSLLDLAYLSEPSLSQTKAENDERNERRIFHFFTNIYFD